MSSKVILVTGANKGIGFEIVRQLSARGHHVLLAARDPEKGLSAVKQLQAEKLSASFVPLDITQDASIVEAVQQVKTHFDKIDVLMNNAAILLKKDQSLMNGDWSIIEQTIHADALAQLKVSRAFVPILSNGGKIIMTSSGGGSMTDPVGGWSPAYCISKSLLNAITRHLAYELEGRRIAVNAFCPGWVKTDMGGRSAPRSVAHGAETGVWLATNESNATGKFFRDKKEIPW